MLEKSLALILALCIFIGCSDENRNEKVETLTFLDNNIVEKGTVFSYDESSLQTLIRLQAASYLLNYQDPLHIKIHGQFLASSSMLRVNAYTQNLRKNNGVRLEFVPNHTDETIDVFLFHKDFQKFKFCSIPNALSKNHEFELVVQMRTDIQRGPHILVWNTYIDNRTDTKKNYHFFDEKTADCSTLDKVFIDHFGQGRLWGLDILQTRLYDVYRSEAL